MAVITYADLENILRTTFSATDQTRVAALIGYLEAWLKAKLFDWTYSASASVTVYGSGSRYLRLTSWCTTVTGITVEGSALTADELLEVVNNGFYLYRKDGEVWDDDDEVVVTGAWGWNTDGDIPANFKNLVRFAFLETWKAFGDGQNLKAFSAGDYSETYVDGLLTNNAMFRTLLSEYMLPAVY